MTPAERAREIVGACRHGAGMTSRRNTSNAAQPEAACEACIAAALVAQAAQTDSGLHTYRGTPVSCEEYEQLIVAPLRQKAAQTRALLAEIDEILAEPGTPPKSVWLAWRERHREVDR